MFWGERVRWNWAYVAGTLYCGLDRQTVKQTGRQTNRQTDKQTGRQTDKQTDRQTDRQAGRQAGRQTDRQTDRLTDCLLYNTRRDTQTDTQTKTDRHVLIKVVSGDLPPIPLIGPIATHQWALASGAAMAPAEYCVGLLTGISIIVLSVPYRGPLESAMQTVSSIVSLLHCQTGNSIPLCPRMRTASMSCS